MPKINAKDSKIDFKRCKFEIVILNHKKKYWNWNWDVPLGGCLKSQEMSQLFKNIILYKSFSSKTEADFCWFFALSVRNYGDACCRTPPPPLALKIRYQLEHLYTLCRRGILEKRTGSAGKVRTMHHIITPVVRQNLRRWDLRAICLGDYSFGCLFFPLWNGERE